MSAIVYCLKTPHSSKIYVGSSKHKASVRLTQHRSSYRGGNRSVSCYKLFDEGINDVFIEVLEECPFENRKVRERHWKDHFGNDCVNIITPSRTKKEYDREYGFIHKERKRQYRQDNKERISATRKARYERQKAYLKEKIPCEYCGCIGVRANLKRHQQTEKCLLSQNSRSESSC